MAAGTTAREFTQSDSEVVLKLPFEADKDKTKLKVKIETQRIIVSVAGQQLCDIQLSNKIIEDDSDWALEGSGAARLLVLTLTKKKSGKWSVLSKDEEDTLPTKGELDGDFDVTSLEHDDDDPERVEEQEENERKLEARYAKLKSENGLDNEDTLKTFFALFDNCIQLYRLNKLSDYLEEVVPVCRKRDDKFKLKAVQALAFVRWKQSRFREALPLFHEMEEILGKGAALCENIAHTYNSLGDYEKAEDYFRQSLKFIEQECGPNQGNRGGVLLGLGLVRDRLGKHKEGLTVCLKAYEFYKDRARGAPASLQAKAGISCAKLHAKLGNLPKAEEFIREAVSMYEVTCGETSPLTASAYHELGKCLWKQRKRDAAQKALKRAYEIESMKDAWDLVSILEIHNLLMDTHLKETEQIERQKFQPYFKMVEYVSGRVRKGLPQDGNAAVYYKAAAELKAWGGQYEEAKTLFLEAIPLFRTETAQDCSGLLNSCNEMLAFCDRNLEGTQNSPMDFEIKGKADADVDMEETDGVKIEEVDDEEEAGVTRPAAGAAHTPAATVATTSTAASSSDQGCSYRLAAASDCNAVMKLCAALRPPCEALLPVDSAFARHLAGPGAGLCFAAEKASSSASSSVAADLVGYVLCGSDGIYGQVQQLVGSSAAVRQELAERCVGACRGKGLRGVRLVAGSAGDEDEALFEKLGWRSTYRVFAQDFENEAPAKKSKCEEREAPKIPSELRGAGKTMDQFYGAWNELNVEKTLVAEDGGDTSIVPDTQVVREDFGDYNLDVAFLIPKFAWDQSDNFVSLIVSFDGVGALPPTDVECIFRSFGVLLLVKQDGKRYWYKATNLCKELDLAACKKTVKADSVSIKLKKLEVGASWSDLTDTKDRYQKKREYRIQHGDLKGATTEDLLADMYQNATDEERDGLRDAMRVNREKREGDQKGK